MADEEKIEELVRQMLLKAESTTFEAERETFNRAAEKLIIKHKLDRAKLAQESGRDSSIGSRRFSFIGQYGRARWFVDMAARGSGMIINALGYQGVWHRSRAAGFDETSAWADEDDLEMIEDLCRHIAGQAWFAVESWWKETQRDARGGSRYTSAAERSRAKHDFVWRFYSVAALRIQEERERQEAEATKGSELVLSRQRYVDACEGEIGELKQTRPPKERDAEAVLAGHLAGERADVHGRRRIS